MKPYLPSILVFFSLLLSHCSRPGCESDRIDCPTAFNSYISNFPDFKEGDSLVYVNDNGQRLVYNVNYDSISKQSSTPCYESSDECSCNQCVQYRRYDALMQDNDFVTDTNVSKELWSFIVFQTYVDRESEPNVNYVFEILDFRNGFHLNFDEPKEYYESFILGGNTYSKVYKVNNVQPKPSEFIEFLYFSLESGIVGFQLKKDSTLMYREN